MPSVAEIRLSEVLGIHYSPVILSLGKQSQIAIVTKHTLKAPQLPHIKGQTLHTKL